jgi:uncharacterized protein
MEVKHSHAPGLTPSMRVVLQDLRLERLGVVYPGTRRYEFHERVSVMPVRDLAGAGLHTLFRGRRFRS